MIQHYCFTEAGIEIKGRKMKYKKKTKKKYKKPVAVAISEDVMIMMKGLKSCHLRNSRTQERMATDYPRIGSLRLEELLIKNKKKCDHTTAAPLDLRRLR